MYLRRQEGRVGARASTGPINPAIAGYEAAASRDPDSVEARWKLMRALYFKGDYTGLDEDGQEGGVREGQARRRRGDRRSWRRASSDKGVRGHPRARPGDPRGRSEGPLGRGARPTSGPRRAGASGRSRRASSRRCAWGAADKIRRLRPDRDRHRPRLRGRRRLPRRRPAATTRRPGSRSSPVGSRADEALKYLRLAMKVTPRNFSTGTSSPRRSTTAATRRSRPRRSRSRRGSWPTRRLPSAWSRSSRCRSWRARTSRPGRKPRSRAVARGSRRSSCAGRQAGRRVPPPRARSPRAARARSAGADIRGWGRIGSEDRGHRPPRSRMSTSISRGPFAEARACAPPRARPPAPPAAGPGPCRSSGSRRPRSRRARLVGEADRLGPIEGRNREDRGEAGDLARARSRGGPGGCRGWSRGRGRRALPRARRPSTLLPLRPSRAALRLPRARRRRDRSPRARPGASSPNSGGFSSGIVSSIAERRGGRGAGGGASSDFRVLLVRSTLRTDGVRLPEVVELRVAVEALVLFSEIRH